MQIEWKRRWIILGIAVGVYAGFRFLLPAVIPFLAAWMLADFLYPAAVKIEKKMRVKRSIAGAVMLTLLLAAAGMILVWLFQELMRQVRRAVLHIPELLEWCGRLLDSCCILIEKNTGILQEDSRAFLTGQMGQLRERVTDCMGKTGGIAAGIKGIFFILSAVVVAYICTILFIGDMEHIRKKFREYSWLSGARHVLERLGKSTIMYLKAQIILMVLTMICCTVGFWLMKNPYFLVLGIVLGFLDMLPVLGTGCFLYPAALIFLLDGNTYAAGICVGLDIVTSLLREFLEPRLLGGGLGVSPVIMLASVYIGVFLYGGWGVFLGPLSYSAACEIGREWDIWD